MAQKTSMLVAELTENPFAMLCECLWGRGEDGEELAKLLAKATRAMIHDGLGSSLDGNVHDTVLHAEFDRLLKLP